MGKLLPVLQLNDLANLSVCQCDLPPTQRRRILDLKEAQSSRPPHQRPTGQTWGIGHCNGVLEKSIYETLSMPKERLIEPARENICGGRYYVHNL